MIPFHRQRTGANGTSPFHARSRLSHPSLVGFTVIELLVVIAVIATLAGLTLTSVNVIRTGARKSTTGTILACVRQGMDLALATSGATFSPVEHPLAGSRPPRAIFSGLRGQTWNAVSRTAVGGARIANLDTTGEALSGLQEWELGNPVTNLAERQRLLIGDDTFADPSVPLLYGLSRSACRILGASLGASTRYRELPKPRPPAKTLVAAGYASADFPDSNHLISGSLSAKDSERILSYILGASGIRSELESLKALRSPPDDDAANRIHLPTALGSGADDAGRVWSAEPLTGNDLWKPGLIQDGHPDWKPYQLRGLAIYDAWGREILCSFSQTGGMILQSAGADGCMRWHPGVDAVYQTNADDGVASGDDRDATFDNITNEGH
jgi:type II secretory pathway pseudopilin PulG